MKSEHVYHQLRESCLKAKEKGIKFKTGEYLYFNEIYLDENDIIGCCALGSFIIDNFNQYMNTNLITEKFIAKKLSISSNDISAIARGFDNYESEFESNIEFFNIGQKLREEFYND